jgi:erythromycin esterase-like protein
MARALVWAAGLALVAVIASAPLRCLAAAPNSETAALESVTRDACHKDVVLLGESTHGDGRTTAFKAALVRRLVERCSFNAVFFEGSFYDFLKIDRRARAHEAVTPQMVSSAVGWLWNHDAEFEPLVPFLTDKVRVHRVVIGGLDDQFGIRDAFYSNDQMLTELTATLPQTRRDLCRKAFDRESPEDRETLKHCLADVRTGIQAGHDFDAIDREDRIAMVDNLLRWNSRDFSRLNEYFQGRDYSMFLNLRWLAQRLPPHSKIIIWCATAHAAKVAHNLPDYGDGDVQNLGAYVHAAYGSRAFALGVTAASGSYRWSSKENRPIPAPPPGALEAVALKPDDAIYLDAEALAKRGVAPSELFQHQYRDADWSKVLDGVVVFGAERPPMPTDETGPP